LLSKQFNLCRCTGESQGELANTMGDMNAAKTRYEEKERIFQVGVEAAKEAAAAADELREDLRTQREDLRAAQRKVLDLRQELLDAKAECAKAVAAAADIPALRAKVAKLEARLLVTLGLNISAVDHIVVNDAAREARVTATKEAEMVGLCQCSFERRPLVSPVCVNQ
jgi:chromosome segregation ATPase